MLVLDDICKATNAQLDWNIESNTANITYNGTYFKTGHTITEEEKIKYGIYVPSLDTYLYIGMPKEEVEKLLGKGELQEVKYNNYLYKDKNNEIISIQYNPLMTQVTNIFVKSIGTEKFDHKVGDAISLDYPLKENERWLSFGMYSETNLAIDDLEDSKCRYQFLNDGEYYFDINGNRKYQAPTKIIAISMAASEDLINELGIDMTTK